MSHNERCKECKVRVRELLEKTYGTVITNYRIPVSTKPEDLQEHPHYPALGKIFVSLQNHRGFTEFVRASYVDVDFFVPDPGFIVEFDESQHFTEPRKIALAHYPSDFTTGFSRETWMKHCDEIHAYDNDPPFRDEQRAWYDTLRDFLPAFKGFLPTIRLFAREMEWCAMDPENPYDRDTFRKLLTDKIGFPLKESGIHESPAERTSDFIVTVILASHLKTPEWGLKQEKDPALNPMRIAEMKQIIASTVSNTTGDGIILFPGGWFHSGQNPAHSLYQWVQDEIVSEIKDNNRKIIVSLGIDGSFDRPVEEDPYDKDQIALAIDKSGIIAIGRKFFPGLDEGGYITFAQGYLEKEEGLSRIFQLNGTRYFLFECNDIKAPYHDVEKYRNPGADIGLNLIHRINEKGQPLSQENNFSCIFGARTSYQWDIPVFLSVIFFRKNVPEDWPSGVFCPRSTPYRIGYDEISLTHTSPVQIPLTEGYAEVRIFRDIGTSVQRLKNASSVKDSQPCKRSNGAPEPESGGMSVHSTRQPARKHAPGMPAGKYRPRFEEIIREFQSVIPVNVHMKMTSSRSNCIVQPDDFPHGIHFEFDDWKDRISVELDLNLFLLPQYEARFLKAAHQQLTGLPVPQFKKQANGWLRLQLFFPETVPAPEIARAMNRLIDEMLPVFSDKSATGI